jgi:hypothetical protein
VDTAERLYAMMFSADGQFLVTGGDRKVVVIRNVHEYDIIFSSSSLSFIRARFWMLTFVCAVANSLAEVYRFGAAGSIIRSIASTPNEQHLLVGLQTGHIIIYALNATYLRKRFLKRLANLGF